MSFYSGNPCVAFENGGPVTVKTYNGSSWSLVGGSSGINPNSVDGTYSYALYNGTSYLAYPALSSSGPLSTYMSAVTFNGSSWVSIGGLDITAYPSSDNPTAPSLYIDNTGTPYLAYYSGSVNLEEYTSGSWSNLGSPSGSSGGFPSLYVYSGTAYVAYWDGSNRPSVMSYNGTFSQVGASEISTDTPYDLNITGYNGTLYLAYGGYNGNGEKANVWSSTGGSWSSLGGANFSAGEADDISIYIYNGTPYVAYLDHSLGEDLVVQTYNGSSWVGVGSSSGVVCACGGAPAQTSIFVNNGTPYVSYESNFWTFQ